MLSAFHHDIPFGNVSIFRLFIFRRVSTDQLHTCWKFINSMPTIVIARHNSGLSKSSLLTVVVQIPPYWYERFSSWQNTWSPFSFGEALNRQAKIRQNAKSACCRVRLWGKTTRKGTSLKMKRQRYLFALKLSTFATVAPNPLPQDESDHTPNRNFVVFSPCLLTHCFLFFLPRRHEKVMGWHRFATI